MSAVAATRPRWRSVLWAGTVAAMLLGGCHRQRVGPTKPPVLQAPALQPPDPVAPAMEGPPPQSVTTAPAVKVTEAKPVRRPRKTQGKPASAIPAPVETAAVTPPPAISVLGALTTGGEVGPKVQQETADLIAADERRLQAVAGTKARQQQTQLKEVRHFLDQAKEVLASGDAEGAKTLATKAKVLIDDLEQWAAR